MVTNKSEFYTKIMKAKKPNISNQANKFHSTKIRPKTLEANEPQDTKRGKNKP